MRPTRGWWTAVLVLLGVEVGPAQPVEIDESEPTPAPTVAASSSTAGAFGYGVFQNMPVVEDAPGAVDPTYPVGPGDEILITAWGQVELQHSLIVDREGGITVPRVGRLQVTGQPLRELEDKVRRFLSTSYSSIATDGGTASTQVEVTLGRLRSIQIFVLGEVGQPGAYVVQATSSVLNGLAAAGGPLSAGSLRQVRLVRHDRVASKIDFYRFLLQGDKDEEARLQHGDVIVVPPVGITVTLDGKVHRPARYELVDGEGLQDLLDMAGGLLAEAYARRMQVQRVVANERRQVIDVDYAQLAGTDAVFPMADGDRVQVFGIDERYDNAVTIRGAVRRPGIYEWQPGFTIADLVEQSENLLDEAFLGRAHLVRTHSDMRREFIDVHLGRALADDRDHNLVLAPLDELTVFTIHAFDDNEAVYIEGLVRAPGEYERLEGMSLTDLIASAGGLQDEAYRLGAEVARIDPQATERGAAVQVLRVGLIDRYEVDVPSEASDFALQDGDRVFVRRNPDAHQAQLVTISGQVRLPGRYVLRDPDERVSDLVARAGGVRPDAFPSGARFTREGLGHIAVDFPGALARPGTEADIALRPGDSIVVPLRPVTVTVSGAVARPMATPHRQGAGPGHYLSRVGGMNAKADGARIYLVLPNGDLRRPRRWLWLWQFWPEIPPGTQIVVPTRG
jgi:protein involved in polysaccharide export with SLBB domain